ncbi:MAG: hypothetical protein IKL55_05320 [Clostridia bacterium]|nr:hypothetical protein [Clostridia bacterium]
MARFDWLKGIKKGDVNQRLNIYRNFTYFNGANDRKFLRILSDMLANDEDVLKLDHSRIDDLVFELLKKCVDNQALENCAIFAKTLKESEDENYKRFAKWVEDTILHVEKPEEIGEILSEPDETAEMIDNTNHSDDSDEISVEEFEKQIISIDRAKIIDLFDKGKIAQAKAFVGKMKTNPNKYRTYGIELLRMNAAKLRESALTLPQNVAERLEVKAQENERRAIEETRFLATQKDPLEDELLPIIMKNAMLDPEDDKLAEKFALRYLNKPTCFRSIEKEAICVMLVRAYKKQGAYGEIINLLDTLMSGLNDSNRTQLLNPYERELLRNLGEAYLIQSQGKLSLSDETKLTDFIANFSDPNNPQHINFQEQLIADLKSKEATFNIDIVNFSLIPSSKDGKNGGIEPPGPTPGPGEYGTYSSELSIEKRLEYILQKEASIGFVPRGYMSLEEENFTGYLIIRGESLDGEQAEPFYHAEKMLDINKLPKEKRTEALKQLRDSISGNPNLDIYTLRDIAIKQIGIPQAYGAASYLIKADDDEVGITTSLRVLAQKSELIDKFEAKVKELEKNPGKRAEIVSQYKVLTYNHTTGKNESNPNWYNRTNRAYDAFRALTAISLGMTYQKREEEENFEVESRQKRVQAYISNPNIGATERKIYQLIDRLEDSKLKLIKLKSEISEIEREIGTVPNSDVELIAEADVLLQRLAEAYKKKFGKDIYEDANLENSTQEQSLEQFISEPRNQKEQAERSKFLAKYDSRYEARKKSYLKEVSKDDVVPENATKEKMIELLMEYREFSYRAAMDYRKKIVAFANLKSHLPNIKSLQSNLKQTISDLEKGIAIVDPLTDRIIYPNQTPASPPSSNGGTTNEKQKTGTDR